MATEEENKRIEEIVKKMMDAYIEKMTPAASSPVPMEVTAAAEEGAASSSNSSRPTAPKDYTKAIKLIEEGGISLKDLRKLKWLKQRKSLGRGQGRGQGRGGRGGWGRGGGHNYYFS